MLFLNYRLENITEQQLEYLIQLLPSQRREAALRHNRLDGRRESVLAYHELCRGLQEEYGINEPPLFCFTPTGKPLLEAHPHIHFSLSHCNKAVGCLLSDHPCGLDIERIRPLRPELVRHTMNKKECEQIFNACHPEVAFIRKWTQKEAVLKLRGTGIAGQLVDALSPQNLQDITIKTQEYISQGFILTCAWQK